MNAVYESRTTDFSYRDDRNSNVHLTCGAHLHYHIEFVYLLSGSTRCFVDSSTYDLQQGDALVIFPNQIHHFESGEDERYMLFIVNPDLMPELTNAFQRGTPECAKIPHLDNSPTAVTLLGALAKTDAQPDKAYNDAIRKGYLLAFFGQLLNSLRLSAEPRSGDSHALRTIVNYCSHNFTRDLSLRTLEEELHLSKYYISHLFGHKLGVSFNDYINFLRVSDACRYLRSTDQSIIEISNTVGFNTLRTFNRAFAKQMRISPSEYRKAKPTENPVVSLPD